MLFFFWQEEVVSSYPEISDKLLEVVSSLSKWTGVTDVEEKKICEKKSVHRKVLNLTR